MPHPYPLWCPGPEELGVIASAQGTDKERLLAKDLTEGHIDELIPHKKERDSEIVHVWDCTIKDSKTVQIWDYTINESLKDLIGTTYINKMHYLFDSSILGTPKLSVLDLEQH